MFLMHANFEYLQSNQSSLPINRDFGLNRVYNAIFIMIKYGSEI